MIRRRLPPVFASLVLLAAAWPALAQRNFTQQALRGELVVGQPPEVSLNGKPARLAPGARIRDENNIVQLSGTLSGRKLVVFYTLEPGGEVLDVWILNAEERARKPWPTTVKEAQTWTFNPFTQSWAKP
ncbi:MAG: hypothetical protein J0L57_17060 [Burkholderiales bacterium]|nr:hypothetical protein [Burkholderiales bacterium]